VAGVPSGPSLTPPYEIEKKLIHFSTLKKEEAESSYMFVAIYQTTRHHLPENISMKDAQHNNRQNNPPPRIRMRVEGTV
jgi:hypothetical protein